MDDDEGIGIASKPPLTDGFHRLTKRVRKNMKQTQKDAKFLKKMNASFPDLTCTIDSFVDISGHHHTNSPDMNGPGARIATAADAMHQDASEDEDECPDIRGGILNSLSK